MIRKYRQQISETDDLNQIGALLLADNHSRKKIARYIKTPFDADTESVGKGAFTLATYTASVSDFKQYDPEQGLVSAANLAQASLACTGARFLTSRNEDDKKMHVLGIIRSEKHVTPMAFRQKGDTIYLIGRREDEIDSHTDMQTLEILVKAIDKGCIASAHTVSGDGLFLSLVEACAPNRLGFDITGDAEIEDKEFLFGPSRYTAIVTVTGEQENELVDYLFNQNIPVTLLGHVTKGEMRMDDLSFGYISDLLPNE